jgi:A/G-specific adenine glycosylase
VPVVDVNIERVLSRLWKPMPNFAATLPMRDIYELDASILPKDSSGVWHEALMDLGATICTKRAPRCEACPLRPCCPSGVVQKMRSTQIHSKQEVRYFGEPRRIWRGRILQLVSKNESLTKGELISDLKACYTISEKEFLPFVQAILSTLELEGFLAQTKKGAFHLANHQ